MSEARQQFDAAATALAEPTLKLIEAQRKQCSFGDVIQTAKLVHSLAVAQWPSSLRTKLFRLVGICAARVCDFEYSRQCLALAKVAALDAGDDEALMKTVKATMKMESDAGNFDQVLDELDTFQQYVARLQSGDAARIETASKLLRRLAAASAKGSGKARTSLKSHLQQMEQLLAAMPAQSPARHRVLFRLAVVHELLGNLCAAWDGMRRVRAFFSASANADDVNCEAKVVLRMGRCLCRFGLVGDALPLFVEAERLHQRAGDIKGQFKAARQQLKLQKQASASSGELQQLESRIAKQAQQMAVPI